MQQYFFLLCVAHSAVAQINSISVVRSQNNPPYSLTEGIDWKADGEFEYTINGQVDPIRVFSINKYKKFKEFFQEKIKEGLIEKIEKVQNNKDNLNKYYEESERMASYEYSFYFYDGKDNTHNYTIIISKMWLNYSQEYSIIEELERFRKDFYQEHGCNDFLLIHTVRKGETWYSIASKYNIDSYMLAVLNSEEQLYRPLNKRGIDFMDVGQGIAVIKKGAKIYVPCPIKN